VPKASPSAQLPGKPAIDLVTSFIQEKKEKAKRKLNIIVHNVLESDVSDGSARKQHDIDTVSNVFCTYMGVTPTFHKAFQLGKKTDKSCLLKISIASELDKASIF